MLNKTVWTLIRPSCDTWSLGRRNDGLPQVSVSRPSMEVTGTMYLDRLPLGEAVPVDGCWSELVLDYGMFSAAEEQTRPGAPNFVIELYRLSIRGDAATAFSTSVRCFNGPHRDSLFWRKIPVGSGRGAWRWRLFLGSSATLALGDRIPEHSLIGYGRQHRAMTLVQLAHSQPIQVAL